MSILKISQIVDKLILAYMRNECTIGKVERAKAILDKKVSKAIIT